MIPEPAMHEEMNAEDKAKHERRYRLQDALSLQNRVKEMIVLDAEDVRKNPDMVKILRETRDMIGTLLDGSMSEDQAKGEVSKLPMFDRKKRA